MEEDDLTNSHANKSVDSKETSDDQNSEESGWTGYFEDFISAKQKEEEYSDRNITTYGGATACLASDAASFVDVEYKKSSKTDKKFACSSTDSLPKMSKKLTFKKTRTKEISCDESLEDTATSPVNRPNLVMLMQGKEGSTGHGLEPQTDKRSTSNTELVSEGKNDDVTDLRKKGLCLVPVSMLVNYFG